jgi:AraC-like DNA-binding protein
MALQPIQKQVYEALTQQVNARARQGQLTPVLAKFPLELPDSVEVIKVAQPFLKKPEHHPFALNPDRWPQLNLHACRYPCLAVVLEGEADVLLGLSAKTAASLKLPKQEPGIRALSLSPGHCCLFPPQTPYANSNHPHWYRKHPENARSKVLWLRVLPMGVLLQIARTAGTTHVETNIVLVPDPQFLAATRLLMDVAQNLPSTTEIAQAYLLALMLGIEKSWDNSQLLQTSAEENVKSVGVLQISAVASTAPHPAVQSACAYIHSHLSGRLSLPGIAAQSYVSVAQLKRLFQAELQTPVMKYVLMQRMESAQSLLAQTDIDVEDIGAMCGYRHRTHFSRLFTQTVGVSPRAYRKQTRAQV